MENDNKNCVICSKELIYNIKSSKMKCSICKKEIDSNVSCQNNHFVCDECHSLKGVGYIEKYCLNTKITDPLKLVSELFESKTIKMHGPEHHFLIPAILLTVCYNKLEKDEREKKEKLEIIKKRSQNILGGFCGFYGCCGAAIGSGIFMSVFTNATPLSKKEWSLSNLITAQCLKKIAENGGPRCCKRNTYITIIESVKFLQKHFKIVLATNNNIKCKFSKINNECLKDRCLFFKSLT